ncbi:unnamed protein product [Adineta ricciae]|uniref:Beta-lactamase-related domain-containing protein n=1 Tax=Adineta ricciae TaxID=249248 RepID=A0A815AIL5_ADIRI|nr:unnamed protein product [Adineta ricciae]CAF1257943.1 unnamed protein product [Adineta ricciae]
MFYYWIVILLVLFVQLSYSNEINYDIDGSVGNGWEFVRDLFKENFIKERDLGAQLAIYHQGELVVDLWGGWFDRSYTKRYDNNTLQIVFSSSKGVVAIAAALCVQRGLLSYSDLVTKYWPEYGKYGKDNTTVADILSHRAGLPTDPSPIEIMFNWTAVIHQLENSAPLWPPGSSSSYHALTYGWLAGELIRRVDPKKRSVGQFIQDELARPLNLEFYIGLPSEQEYRVSPLTFSKESLQTFNETVQATFALFNSPQVHATEIPAANGITNARSLARLYASLMTDLDNGQQKRLLNPDILKQALKLPMQGEELNILSNISAPFTMGFMLYSSLFTILGPDTFGHSGAGGSIGLAFPSKNLSFAFVMNQLDPYIITFPRIQTILEKTVEKLTPKNVHFK